MKKPKLLFVDDEEMILDDLEEICGFLDRYEFFSASSGQEALDILRKQKIDLVITDIKMPGMSGLELAGIISKNYPSVKILFMTAVTDLIPFAKNINAIDVIEKPIQSNVMLNRIEQYLKGARQINTGKLVAIAGSVFAFLQGLSSAVAIISGASFLNVGMGFVTIIFLIFCVAVIVRLRKI